MPQQRPMMEEYDFGLKTLYATDLARADRFKRLRDNEPFDNKQLAKNLEIATKVLTELNALQKKLREVEYADGTAMALLKAHAQAVYTGSIDTFEQINSGETLAGEKMVVLNLLANTLEATSTYYSDPTNANKFEKLRIATEALSSEHNSIFAPGNRLYQKSVGQTILLSLCVMIPLIALAFFIGTNPFTTPLFMIKATAQVLTGMTIFFEAVTVLDNLARGADFFNTKNHGYTTPVYNNANRFFNTAAERFNPQPSPSPDDYSSHRNLLGSSV